MTEKPKPKEPKRLNRAVGLGEAMGKALDPVFRKRGFASRDIVTHWAAMAPEPYDKVALPEKLTWPRGAGQEGATLILRCAQSHALALGHEGQRIAAAVNRYFGFFLVDKVRMSAEPFSPHSAEPRQSQPKPGRVGQQAVERAVAEIEDAELRAALRHWGEGIMRNKP